VERSARLVYLSTLAHGSLAHEVTLGVLPPAAADLPTDSSWMRCRGWDLALPGLCCVSPVRNLA
jgi:hypothetical protein